MKDDKSKKEQSEQEGLDAELSSFQQDEEDVDFEILDALEQIEQAGKGSEEIPSEDESTVEFTLDEEELDFGEVDTEDEGEFQFDKEITAGLEGEFIGETETLNLDDSFDEGIGEDLHAEIEEKSFSIDLDQEDHEDELDLSFDEEVDLDLEDTGMHEGINEASFDLEEGGGEFDFDSLETEMEGEEPSEGDFEQSVALSAGETEFDLGVDTEEEIEDTSLSDIDDLSDFDLESSETDSFHVEDLPEQENFEMESEDTEETFEEMNLEDMAAMDENLDFETDSEDTSISDMEVSEMDLQEHETDEFSGKPVISVDGEQVIDLGDETEFEHEEEFGTTEESEESFDISEEEVDMDLEGLEKEVQQIVTEAVSDTTEQEGDEEFMASLEDIEIDLEEETAKVLETLEGEDEVSEFAEEESAEFDVDSFVVTPEEEQEPETSPEETIEAQSLSEMLEESEEELDLEEEGFPSELISATDLEETAEEPELELDEREELGLHLRLTDSEINQFESMVSEAKTLQMYVEELEEHKADIKENIYEKLLQEYTSRKTNIFREPEFISIRLDVEQDLQDMLNTRAEYVSTIDRLNDELEEVKVRHLVGEYSDAMLSERENTQKAEIAQWHDKTERIETFISRYQELLDTERALNPLREESLIEEPEEEPFPESEQEVVPASEEVFQEDEFVIPSEEIVQEEDSGLPDEDLPDEVDVESLIDILAEDTPDELEMPEEDVEITAESGLDEEDFGFGEAALEESDEELSAIEDKAIQDEVETEEDQINCKKCGRPTPASEKFCVNCGAKAQ